MQDARQASSSTSRSGGGCGCHLLERHERPKVQGSYSDPCLAD